MHDEVKETEIKKETQQGNMRGLQDASVRKNSSKSMHNALSKDNSSNIDNVNDDSTFDLLEAEEERNASFNEMHNVNKMSINVIEEDVCGVKMLEKDNKEDIHKGENKDADNDSPGDLD